MTVRLLPHLRFAVAVLVLTMAAAEAAAQGGVGAGPITAALPTSEPTSGVLDWGYVKLAPGLTVTEAGWDSNVFNEAENPKEDWVVRATPDIAAYSRLRWVDISAYAGSKMGYYRTYGDQNSIGYEYRARVDLKLSRLKPFIGAGQTRARQRPSGEIDVRTDQNEWELSGGLSFELGPASEIFAGTSQYSTKYLDGVEEGVELATALNRYAEGYTAGVRTELTPLTTLTVGGSLTRDIFQHNPIRNTDSWGVNAEVSIEPEGAIAGSAKIQYGFAVPEDPLVETFKGIEAAVSLTYKFLEVGRVSGSYLRSKQYSFDEAEGFYIEDSASLSYTQRLFAEIDAQVTGTKSFYHYGYREGVPERTDEFGSVGASLGYNLRNRTRISLNYEVSQRRSPVFADQNYDRQRAFLAWNYAF